MLYDNAQLALAYLHTFLVTKNIHYRQICEETMDFVIREMTHSQGGFYSSLDADSEGEDGMAEGKFYVWTPAEIQAALDDLDDSRLLLATYGVTAAGNFEGETVLQRVLNDEQIAEEFGLSLDQVPTKLTELHQKLLDYRSQRPRPATDDKVLTGWNGLMLIAFAEAGRYLKRDDYTRVAIQNADFLLAELRHENRLLRTWREGQASHNAYLEDYAAFILGLQALYQTDPQTRWFSQAVELADEMVSLFHDPDGGFFDTPNDHEQLIIRPKDVQDNAIPSGNALAANALLRLSAFTGRGDWRDIAEEMLAQMQDMMLRYPTGMSQWLQAFDFAIGPVQEVAILGAGDDPPQQGLSDVLWDGYRPRMVAANSQFPAQPEAPPLLADRPLKDGKSTAYVCQGFVCQQPVNSPEELRSQLK